MPLPKLSPIHLRRALLAGGGLAVALFFYTDLLPDRGGAAACVRELGYDPQAYGARFSPQYLLNGSCWWSTYIYRYRMSPADFARLKADMLAEGATFCGSGSDGLLGTVAAHYYPIAVEDEIEVGYPPGRTVITYNHRDEQLYVEYTFGSWRKGNPKQGGER